MFEHVALNEQIKVFERMVMANPVVAQIVDRLPALELPDCWLTAGCLVQTVWNLMSDRPARDGIVDYDVNYFDDSDLSWDAEHHVIARAARVFDGIDAAIQLRNEARVHLWYEAKFGVPCPGYQSTAHAVATFPSCSSCLAVRPGVAGGLELLAPYGLADVFTMTTRPNPALAPATVYVQKTDRWVRQWPGITVLPWAPEA